MKSNSKNHPNFFSLLTFLILISCGGGGGDGGININVDGGNFPPVAPPINTDFAAEETFSFVVEIVNQTRFNLIGKNGEITVTGQSGANSVIVSGIKRVRSDSIKDAEERLQELEVNVQSLETEVRVETMQPQDTEGRKYEVDYTITLPKFLANQLANTNGAVTLDSIENDVAVNNVNGSITLRGIVGSVLVNLVNGTIESEVSLPLNARIELNTMNGAIGLDIPVNTSAEFSAAVNIGSISVSNLMLQNEVRTANSLSGTLGSGQGMIRLETEQVGNIRVTGV